MATTAVSGGRWTRVRTLGRGASGAEVWLAADAATGALCAVKSAPASAAEQLRREARILSALRSPHVLHCLGFKEDASGECRLFLEYAPGGTLADAAARRLGERAVRAYAADVARALAYLHGESLVHGDVKPRNVVIGADGRAKLADFGCARPSFSSAGHPTIIGGTPAFMAPEVARGEAQGPPADVWALGCTVLEMATGRAPWGGDGTDNLLAAVHRVGFTDATPNVPAWLSPDARDFLARCFARDPRDRPTAAELLEHPFLTGSVACEVEAEEMQVPAKWWVSPKSTLDAALWESDTDDDDVEMAAESLAQRIKALAGPCSALPDWEDCDNEGWIEVLNDQQCKAASNSAAAATKAAAEKEMSGEEDEFVVLGSEKTIEAEAGLISSDADADSAVNLCCVHVGSAARSAAEQRKQEKCPCCNVLPPVDATVCNSNRIEMAKPLFCPNRLLVLLLPPVPLLLPNDNKLCLFQPKHDLELPEHRWLATVPEGNLVLLF